MGCLALGEVTQAKAIIALRLQNTPVKAKAQEMCGEATMSF